MRWTLGSAAISLVVKLVNCGVEVGYVQDRDFSLTPLGPLKRFLARNPLFFAADLMRGKVVGVSYMSGLLLNELGYDMKSAVLALDEGESDFQT